MTTDTISRYYEAEATCIHCGRLGGLVRSLRPAMVVGSLFVPAGGGEASGIKALARGGQATRRRGRGPVGEAGFLGLTVSHGERA